MEWSNSLLRHFKIQTLLKINCCMAAISAFRVTQHSQIFRTRIQCIALHQLHNSQALLNLRHGHFSAQKLIKQNGHEGIDMVIHDFHGLKTINDLQPHCSHCVFLTCSYRDNLILFTQCKT